MRQATSELPATTGPFRPQLRLLTRFDHGPSEDAVRALSGLATIANLSTNESAFPPSPAVKAAVAAALDQAWRYPDPASSALRAGIGAHLGVADDRIVCGTGSEALLEILARAVLEPGDTVLVSPPTFPIYAQYARLLGAQVAEVPRHRGFALDVDRLVAALAGDVRILFLCNPNNPTGTAIPADELAAIAAAAGQHCLIVVDEAYHEFAQLEQPTATLDMLDRSGAAYVVLRTFSKAFALGGFRVGYAVASDAGIAAGLDLARTQFPVSTLASVAAVAALSDPAHLAHTVGETRLRRDALRRDLSAAGIDTPASAANFLFVPTGDPAIEQHLLRQGVMVRPVGTLGLRVTVGTPEQNARFLDAMPKPTKRTGES